MGALQRAWKKEEQYHNPAIKECAMVLGSGLSEDPGF